MMTDTAAVAGAKSRPYPTYLARVDQWVGDVLFTCWYDYEPADAGVGFNATAWLVHAHVHGHPADLIDFLRDSVVKDLEEEAACLLSSD
jgi:hypothetical protein